MRQLKHHHTLRGLGFVPAVTATQLQRSTDKAIYERSDGYFEVFKILHTKHARKLPNGEILLAGEVYPGTEQFGVSAWCVRDRDKAMNKYNNI